jgi:hypothetical protein
MPKGSIIHFRYKLKYVAEDIYNDISRYINHKVVIFFSANHLTAGKDIQNIPIRIATLFDAEFSPQTDLFHAYLKLEDFCNVVFDPTSELDNKAPDKSFGILQGNIVSNTIFFHEKARSLSDYFDKISFYHLNSIKDSSGKEMTLKISKRHRSYFYKLNHGKKYFANISLANYKVHPSALKICASSEDITANIQNPLRSTVQADDIVVPLYLKTLNVVKESSFISISPILLDANGNEVDFEKPNLSDEIQKELKDPNSISNTISEYQLNIEIQKTIGIMRPTLFGVFTLLAVLSIWIIQGRSKSLLNIGQWSSPFDWILALAMLVLTVSSGLLFSHFNKK